MAPDENESGKLTGDPPIPTPGEPTPEIEEVTDPAVERALDEGKEVGADTGTGAEPTEPTD
ncbi:hypothetical protein [Kribbella deserti]|uniref:Uncharacterized protein n=1 Tax=Kribbella deserti TaxID=1926257 RepID=A0ABV6QHM5_9ACTN